MSAATNAVVARPLVTAKEAQMTELEKLLRALAEFEHTTLDHSSICHSPAGLTGTTTVEGPTGPATLYWGVCGGLELLNVRWIGGRLSHLEDVNIDG